MRTYQILVIIAVLFTLVFGGLFGWQFFAGRKLARELAEKTDRVTEAKEAKVKSQKLQAEVISMHAEMTGIEEKIPQDEMLSFGLIRRITLVAARYGFRQVEFSAPQEPAAAKTFGAGAVPKQAPKSGLEVKSVFLQMSCEGEYTKLIDFLRAVSELDRLVLVNQLTIQRLPGSIPRQSLVIEFITYTFASASEHT